MTRVLQTLVALTAGLTALSATPLAAQSDHSQHHPPSGSTSIVRTPPSLAAEHRELHETLSRAVAVGGELGSVRFGVVREAIDQTAVLLFDAGHSWSERILAEQFRY